MTPPCLSVPHTPAWSPLIPLSLATPPALPLDSALQSASTPHPAHTSAVSLDDRMWDSVSPGPSATLPVAKRNSEGWARCSVPSSPHSLLGCSNYVLWLAGSSRRGGGSTTCPWLKAEAWSLRCRSQSERKIRALKCSCKKSCWREVHSKKCSDCCCSW